MKGIETKQTGHERKRQFGVTRCQIFDPYIFLRTSKLLNNIVCKVVMYRDDTILFNSLLSDRNSASKTVSIYVTLNKIFQALKMSINDLCPSIRTRHSCSVLHTRHSKEYTFPSLQICSCALQEITSSVCLFIITCHRSHTSRLIAESFYIRLCAW